MSHVTWVIEAISMTTMFVRSYNLACKAFLYLTSINSSSCLSKAKIIIGDLNPAGWWIPVEQSITFISKIRFLWRHRYKIATKVAPVSLVMLQDWQWCDKSATKNGSFEATEVSLPSNVDLILDLPNLWHPNQQACIPVDLNWQIKLRNNLVSHLWQIKKRWRISDTKIDYSLILITCDSFWFLRSDKKSKSWSRSCLMRCDEINRDFDFSYRDHIFSRSQFWHSSNFLMINTNFFHDLLCFVSSDGLTF